MTFHSTFPVVKQLKAKMKYRELDAGEKIKAGDEWLLVGYSKATWQPVKSKGSFDQMFCHPKAVRIRRKVLDDGKTISS